MNEIRESWREIFENIINSRWSVCSEVVVEERII